MSGVKVRDKNQRRERGVGAPGSENPRKKIIPKGSRCEWTPGGAESHKTKFISFFSHVHIEVTVQHQGVFLSHSLPSVQIFS